jgi:hypothetical protein
MAGWRAFASGMPVRNTHMTWMTICVQVGVSLDVFAQFSSPASAFLRQKGADKTQAPLQASQSTREFEEFLAKARGSSMYGSK